MLLHDQIIPANESADLNKSEALVNLHLPIYISAAAYVSLVRLSCAYKNTAHGMSWKREQ